MSACAYASSGYVVLDVQHDADDEGGVMAEPDYQELYEQAKRVLRGTANMSDYDKGTGLILACHECGLAFPTDAEVGMIAQHAEIAHEWDESQGNLEIDMVWIGVGDPPEPRR